MIPKLIKVQVQIVEQVDGGGPDGVVGRSKHVPVKLPQLQQSVCVCVCVRNGKERERERERER